MNKLPCESWLYSQTHNEMSNYLENWSLSKCLFLSKKSKLEIKFANLKQSSAIMLMCVPLGVGFAKKISFEIKQHLMKVNWVFKLMCCWLMKTCCDRFLAHLIHHQMCLCYQKLDICNFGLSQPLSPPLLAILLA